MAVCSESQDRLSKKFHDVASRLGWIDEPVDDLCEKISKILQDMNLDDSSYGNKRDTTVLPKQIIISEEENKDDDKNDVYPLGKQFNFIEEDDKIISPESKADNNTLFTPPHIKLDNSSCRVKNGATELPKKIITDEDDNKDVVYSLGKQFNSINEDDKILSPEEKADENSPFSLPQKSLRERVFKKYNLEHSPGSDSDDLESFLDKVRTPRPRWSDSPQQCVQSGDDVSKQDDFDDFIVNDDGFLNENDNVLDEVFIVDDDCSDEEKENIESKHVTPLYTPQSVKAKPFKNNGNPWKTPISTRKPQQHPATDYPRRPRSALESVITPYSTQKEFKRNKEVLVKKLFQLYNTTVFENKLPSDFGITWNSKMRSTAGFCYYGRKNGVSTARIELADKVIDSADRLRDTLIHEMCHAATWLINGVRAGHGPLWKNWARRANYIHQDLPSISRCHSYRINAKFTYHCTNEFCSNSVGRHSKSLDVEKFRCSYCHSRFELQPQLKKDGTPQTTRTPNRFAMFVKENYGKIKKTGMIHKDVMKELSSQFNLMNTK